jgi:hypothetical protein
MSLPHVEGSRDMCFINCTSLLSKFKIFLFLSPQTKGRELLEEERDYFLKSQRLRVNLIYK